MSVSETDFLLALRDPGLVIPAGLIDHNGAPAGRRFNVYRNNVTTSLMDALQDGYPVIYKLLGEANFRNIAREFQAAHPPTSPLMMRFGAKFPEFLGGIEQLRKYPYLGDVARLECALRKSYHAADATQIDPALLGKLTEDQLLASRIQLAPSVQLMASKWPALGVWLFNTNDDAPKPVAQSEYILIMRADYDPTPELITVGDFALLTTLQEGKTLGAAIEAAMAVQEDHDFGRLLGRLLAGGAITTMDHKE